MMTKKWFCGLLSLAVLTPTVCFAETLTNESGLSLTLPEGLSAQSVALDEGAAFDYQWTLSDGDTEGAAFSYQTLAVPGLEGLNFTDLTEEQLTLFKDAIAQALPGAAEKTAPAEGTAPTEGTAPAEGTAPVQNHLQYALEDDAGAQTHFITLVNGSMVDVSAASSQPLTPGELDLCLSLLTSVSAADMANADAANADMTSENAANADMASEDMTDEDAANNDAAQ